MHIVVVSGGTATNSLLQGFSKDVKNDKVTYILPVSDNGGSSSEIMRVLGGCAIGDIRSRLVRLIEDEELRNLFGHRLGCEPESAKCEWNEIVDGTHDIWCHIDRDLITVIRTFLLYVDTEIRKRNEMDFRFEVASVGNLFLTGARLFFGDFDAGMALMRKLCNIPDQFQVYGVLNTNFTHNIAAILEDGNIIRGQSEISHPSLDIGGSQLHFDKMNDFSLGSKIKKIMYISPYGEEIRVKATEKCIDAVKSCDLLVYSIGSLYTSIVPVLLADGIGRAITTTNSTKYKVLLVNSENDRETEGMDVWDYVDALVRAVGDDSTTIKVTDVVTHIITARTDGVAKLEKAGVKVYSVTEKRLTAANVQEALDRAGVLQ